MTAKIYIIQTSNFIPENYSEVIRDKFKDELYEGIEYKQIFTFEHHIHTARVLVAQLNYVNTNILVR